MVTARVNHDRERRFARLLRLSAGMTLKQSVLHPRDVGRALPHRAAGDAAAIAHPLLSRPLGDAGVQFGECTFIAPEQFEARMARLKRSGVPVLPLGEAVERLGDGTLPDAAVVITIDDGWVSTFTHMLPVLEAYGFPATLYATTWYAGRDLPVINVAVDYLRQAAGRPDMDPHDKTVEIEALPLEQRLAALRRFGAELGVDEAWLERRQFNIMSAAEFAAAQSRGLDVQLHTHRHIEIDRQVDELPRELAENCAFLARRAGDPRPRPFLPPQRQQPSASAGRCSPRTESAPRRSSPKG